MQDRPAHLRHWGPYSIMDATFLPGYGKQYRCMSKKTNVVQKYNYLRALQLYRLQLLLVFIIPHSHRGSIPISACSGTQFSFLFNSPFRFLSPAVTSIHAICVNKILLVPFLPGMELRLNIRACLTYQFHASSLTIFFVLFLQ